MNFYYTIFSSVAITFADINGLISHLHTLKTLLRHGMAIRRSDDSDSNIFQFNLNKARTDSDLKEFMKSKQYFWHVVFAEQEQMLILNA